MREQLNQYVELLFAGVRDCEDIKQEILQNSLDRYDDLIAEGKVPEAAYRLAITGIGDINEILGIRPENQAQVHNVAISNTVESDTPLKKLLRAIAVGLYILCPVPLFILSEVGMSTIGLCCLLAIVAVATVLIILGAKKEPEKDIDRDSEEKRSPLEKSISGLIWAIGIGIYFVINFFTNAWHITWLIFPILGAIDKLACLLAAKQTDPSTPLEAPAANKQRKTIASIINAAGLTIYFLLSFTTHMWYITWLVFPITGAVRGLVSAILDYKEADTYEA